VLVCIDGWSKWTKLIPLSDAEATTVYIAFYNGWVCHHGMPVQLHSDQRANLVKSVGAAVADLLNIYRTRTVSFHPMGNGAAEQAVRNSIKVISTNIAGEENSDPLEWDISCPQSALAINTSPLTSTLQTPWLIKHSSCSEVILSVSIMADDLPSVQDVDVVVRDLQECQKRMFQAVSRATGVAQQRQKGYYDLKVKGLEIQVRDRVVYKDKTNLRTGKIRSLRLPFKEPLFRVTRKLSDMNYKIMADGGQGKIVHYNQIKWVEGPAQAPGDKVPDKVPADEATPAEQQPRRSGRARQRPEHLGSDACDPDVPWIP
jgi:hypothetical protein